MASQTRSTVQTGSGPQGVRKCGVRWLRGTGRQRVHERDRHGRAIPCFVDQPHRRPKKPRSGRRNIAPPKKEEHHSPHYHLSYFERIWTHAAEVAVQQCKAQTTIRGSVMHTTCKMNYTFAKDVM